MAHDEMLTIQDLDLELLNQHKHHIWLYFAESDAWVGQSKEKILKVFESELDSIRVIRSSSDIPHAFCISTYGYLSKQLHPDIFKIMGQRWQYSAHPGCSLPILSRFGLAVTILAAQSSCQ
jgi:hypothetical protein